jgi:5'-nucleotidase
VDVVLSGINLGQQPRQRDVALGYPGRGAKQAVLLGCRGIALSAPTTNGRARLRAAARGRWCARCSSVLLPLGELSLVNVNFPETSPKATSAGRDSRCASTTGRIVPGEDPMGRSHYWFVVFPIEETEEGTDRWAVERGYVSMTPLRLDLTNEAELEKARAEVPVE